MPELYLLLERITKAGASVRERMRVLNEGMTWIMRKHAPCVRRRAPLHRIVPGRKTRRRSSYVKSLSILRTTAFFPRRAM
jgi:hypothetical protein